MLRAMTPARERSLALAAVIGTVTLWGANVALLKVLLSHLNAETINVLRLGVAGAVLSALALRAGGWPRWDVRTWLAVGGAGLLGNSIFQALYLQGVSHAPAGVAGLVNGLVPALVLPLGLLLGQAVTRRQIGGVALAGAGLLGLLLQALRPGTAVGLGGLLWLTGAAASWALYTVLNRPLTVRVGALPFVAASLVLGTVPYALWALPHLRLPAGEPPAVWAGVVLSGLGANVLAYLGWAHGTRVLGAPRTAVWNTLGPVVTLLLSALVLHERLPGSVWLAALVILAGATLANWPRRSAPADPAPG